MSLALWGELAEPVFFMRPLGRPHCGKGLLPAQRPEKCLSTFATRPEAPRQLAWGASVLVGDGPKDLGQGENRSWGILRVSVIRTVGAGSAPDVLFSHNTYSANFF